MYMDKINNYIKPILDPILIDNPYVKTFIIVLLAAYPALARPNLPSSIEKMFEKPLVRFILITYIIYDLETSKDLYLAITISLLFLVIIHQINKKFMDKELNKSNKKL